ncbi:MAG TPA: hypothetical protein VMI31_18955 [Fimbriimonadaceae bacterium]|nr:hypothetical protein [Fimbriimonadaceae bacterium]
MRVYRPAKVVYVHPHVVRVVRVAKDPAMVAASRATREAHAALKLALPVYGGHRDLALALCSLAEKDIKAGLKWTPAAPIVDFTLRKPLKLHKKHKGIVASYFQAQMQASDAELQQAIPMIQSALNALSQARADYGGYRSQAATSLNRALQEIQASLQTR